MPLAVQSIALEISVESGVGHVDGGVHSPVVHVEVNVVADVMFLVTSTPASPNPASAAWNAMLVSLVLLVIFSCIRVLFMVDTPSTASTSRNIIAGNSDM